MAIVSQAIIRQDVNAPMPAKKIVIDVSSIGIIGIWVKGSLPTWCAGGDWVS